MRSPAVIILICLILVLNFPVLAGERVIKKETTIEVKTPFVVEECLRLDREYHEPHRFAFDLYKYFNIKAFGLKYQMITDYFATFNCEFDNINNDLLLSFGNLYRIPRKYIIWHFYLGGECTFSRNNQNFNPYVLFGTDFLFFFSETKLPLTETGKAIYRGGFRFYF
ncbi:hypothetical protein BBF96_00815 [Anoxybacter fermentans]|uniref:Uncharacterized protein n=1 Tax=Anoxybacter fermentans TaxID=1323375 RepID=A0A3Q9HQ19_9FIRM|nr:hypothetical protein [Anoxybacter fermentans]AZR72058.1 hypothetical protein BBF96_00815 [Anoxybacter fermentans]